VNVTDPVAGELVAAGMSPAAAANQASLLHLVAAGLPARPAVSLFVPGRIEFLGKHTDYAGGRSLVGAIERGMCFAACPRGDRKVIVRDMVRQLTSTFDLDRDIAPAYGTWASYGMIVARRIARNFPGDMVGADIHFASDLSPAAGMSTSSALVTGFFHVLARLNHLPERPDYASPISSLAALSEYLGAVENGSGYKALAGDAGVGTSGGSQDHAAILLSEPGSLVQCGFSPVRKESTVPFPRSLTLVIGVSGVVAEKAGAANASYNRIARITRRILDHWNLATGRDDPTLLGALGHSPGAHHELREILDGAEETEFDHSTLVARLEQVVMESTVLIPDAVDALRRGDLAALGTTVDLSQLLAERMLGNQVPETAALARLARELGAVAASAFGAGFGGSVYAVVPEEQAAAFMTNWSHDYLARFPHRRESARFFETRLGPPLTAID
jgi:galactokinase